VTFAKICEKLEAAGIESAAWDGALLIERFCGVRAELVPLDKERDYASPDLQAAVDRRAARYPLQYLLGEWPFYRQTYEVSPDCLIPRSDTERLVEEAIRLLPNGAEFADLCAGSGCIGISVLAERPDTRCVAVEKFAPTLAVAQKNARKNRVSDRYGAICADLLEGDCFDGGRRFDAILSNPPYITEQAMAALAPELAHEPRAALFGGEDGLIFYRQLLNVYARHLTPQGFFLLEIGFDQAQAVLSLGEAAGFSKRHVLRDFGGNDRVVYLGERKKALGEEP